MGIGNALKEDLVKRMDALKEEGDAVRNAAAGQQEDNEPAEERMSPAPSRKSSAGSRSSGRSAAPGPAANAAKKSVPARVSVKERSSVPARERIPAAAAPRPEPEAVPEAAPEEKPAMVEKMIASNAGEIAAAGQQPGDDHAAAPPPAPAPAAEPQAPEEPAELSEEEEKNKERYRTYDDELDKYSHSNTYKVMERAEELKGSEASAEDEAAEAEEKAQAEALKKTRQVGAVNSVARSGVNFMKQVNKGLEKGGIKGFGIPGLSKLFESKEAKKVDQVSGVAMNAISMVTGWIPAIARLVQDIKESGKNSGANRMDNLVNQIDTVSKLVTGTTLFIVQGFGLAEMKKAEEEGSKVFQIMKLVTNGISLLANTYRAVRMIYRTNRLSRYKKKMQAKMEDETRTRKRMLPEFMEKIGVQTSAAVKEAIKTSVNLMGLTSGIYKLTGREKKAGKAEGWAMYGLDTLKMGVDLGMDVYGAADMLSGSGESDMAKEERIGRGNELYGRLLGAKCNMEAIRPVLARGRNADINQERRMLTDNYFLEQAENLVDDMEGLDVTLFAGLDIKLGSILNARYEDDFKRRLAGGFKA